MSKNICLKILLTRFPYKCPIHLSIQNCSYLKTSKSSDDQNRYPPIAFLRKMFKLLERLSHNRISQDFLKVILMEQEGLGPNSRCTQQVYLLSTFKENGRIMCILLSQWWFNLNTQAAQSNTLWKLFTLINNIFQFFLWY